MKRMSASEMILEDINKKILSGEYSTNSKLPNERELALEYDVSRIPVREALKQLAEAGILETKRGVGTFVKSANGISNKSGGKKKNPFLHPENVLLETIRFRKMIEAEGARLAALNATEEEVRELEMALIETIQEIRKMKQGEDNHFFEVDEKFHNLIAKASHYVLISNVLNVMPEIFASHQYWSLKMTTPMDEVVSYHTAIFENIMAGNAEGAKGAMELHLERVEKLLTRIEE